MYLRLRFLSYSPRFCRGAAHPATGKPFLYLNCAKHDCSGARQTANSSPLSGKVCNSVCAGGQYIAATCNSNVRLHAASSDLFVKSLS